MLNAHRIAVVLPAYNAADTLEQTYREIPHDVVDDVILVDDASNDETVARARELGIPNILRHTNNLGYGGNQKTCYRKALQLGADIVVMVHPDYQYTPKLVTALSSMIASGVYDVALASRILGTGAWRGGMPLYKYLANRILTFFQNVVLGCKLSEYHTGYRAFSRKVLENLPLEENSNDFLFDNQMLVQIRHFGFDIAEISCPTRYAPESSSISLWRSIKYGLGVVKTTLQYRLHRMKILRTAVLEDSGRKLAVPELDSLEEVRSEQESQFEREVVLESEEA